MSRISLNGTIGLVLTAIVVLAAVAGLVHPPYDPADINFTARLAAPSTDHWLGTDQFGRDILSRILVGASKSLAISLSAAMIAVAVGLLIGAVAGYFGGWTDRAVMTVLDAFMAFPSLLIALGIMAVVGPSKYGVIGALALAYTPAVVRVVRGTALSIRERDYVEAAQVLGYGPVYTILRHVIPNCLGPVTVIGTSLVAAALLSESALSFLGLGVPPPAPTWGGMLADGRPFIGLATWLTVFPGLAIAVTLLGINLLGDALRDRLDPRMRPL